jgi:oligosaccharide repeat unit polymerase
MMDVLVPISYLAPILTLVLLRLPGMLPATTFLAFYLMHYGPHTLVPDWLRMTDGYSDLAHDRYAMGILFSNFGLSVGMFFSRGLFNIPLGQKTFEDLTTRGAEAGRALLGSRALLFAAFAYALVFAALDGPTLPRTSEYLRYFFSDSIFSYDELRREVFSGSPLEILGQYTRQSTSAILLALCALSVFYTRGLTRLYFLVACIVVFILCSMQLNKFPVPYTLITVFIALYVFRRPRPTIDRKGVTTGIIILVVAALLVQTLYFIQYRDALADGSLDNERLASILFYRTMLTQADALRMWFVEFPDITPFIGLSSFPLGAELTGVRYLNVQAFIPQVYMHAYNTSFTGGFIGSGYAAFGYIGIVIYGGIVGGIVVAISALSVLIKNNAVRSAYIGVMCMNVYFLDSRELTTALVSGGIIPTLFTCYFVDRYYAGRLRSGARQSKSVGSKLRDSGDEQDRNVVREGI